MKIWLQRSIDQLAAMVRSIRGGLREIWNLVVVIVSFFDPRQLPRMIRRDTGAVIDSGKLMASATGTAATDVAKQAALSPRRLVIWCWHAPQRLFHFVITRSARQLMIGGIVAAIGITVTVWPAIRVIREKRQQGLAIEQHRQMEEHFARSDPKGVKHNVEVLLLVNPNDEKMLARKKALETGEAPENDPKVARLLMMQHLSEGKFNLAVREARTCLILEKNDWEALLVVTEDALRRGDRTAASKIIANLPRPHEVRSGATLWSCTMAVRIFRILNEHGRLDDLIAYLSDTYVPFVRRGIANQAEPAGRLQLVEIYNLCMTTLEHRPILQKYWVPVQELCHGIANAPDATVPVLTSLGVMQEIQREAQLRQMLQLKLITTEKYAEYTAEIDARLAVIWRRVHEGDAKNHFGYLGPAMLKARANDLKGAAADIEAGIVACGPIPELIEKKAEVLRRLDPAGGLAFLEQSLAGTQVNPAMCRVVAEAALAAGRPDKALEAASKALDSIPNLPWAIRLIAQIHLDAGRPAEAVAILDKTPIIADDPAVGNLYVRALASSGSVAGAQAFLLKALQSQETLPLVLGGAETLAKLGHHEAAIVILKKLILEDQLNALAQTVLGDTLRLMAERDGTGWNRRIVDDALTAYRNALLRDPLQLRLVNNVAWLELVALDLPKQAYDSAKPLREAGLDLPADMLATLGAVHVGVGAYEQGRIALEKAIAQGNAKAGVRAYLALAYHGLNRSDVAQALIDKAINTAKVGPREGELVELIRRQVERR